MEKRISIGVFDDHPAVLDGIVSVLNGHTETFELLFTATDRASLEAHCQTQVPDVMVLDIVSAEVKALELFEYFRDRYPQTAVVAHSGLITPTLVQNLLFLGVKGFVSKRQSLSELLRCLLLVSEGHISVPEDYRYLVSKYHTADPALLSEREIEIVNLIAREYNSAEIAGQLGLSVNTIENHRKRIFFKLDVKNVAGMVLAASRLAYIRVE